MQILIAEDNTALRLTLKTTIESQGHTCLMAENGEQAWEMYQANQLIDVIISDWLLPGLTGLELCGLVRGQAERGYTYFIFLTASGDKDQILTGIEIGADDYLVKPVNLEELTLRLLLASRTSSLHQRLQSVSDRMRFITNNVPVQIGYVDDKLRFQFINRAIEDWFGVSTQDILGQHLSQSLGPKNFETTLPHSQKALNGQSVSFEQVSIGPNGHSHIFKISFLPDQDETGYTRGYVSLAQDVTQFRLTEQALRESQVQYRTLADNFPNGSVFLFDKNMRYLLAGGSGLKSMGLTSQDMEGHTPKEALPPALARLVEPYTRATIEGQSVVQELNIGERFILLYTLPLRNEEGEVYGGMAMSQDITPQKKAEQALRESEEHYRSLVELSPDTIVITCEGRIVYVNQAALKLYGVDSQAELLGLEALSFATPASAAAIQKRLRVMVEDGQKVAPLEMEIKRPDGRNILIKSVGAPNVYQGRPATMSIIRDVTQHKKAQQVLAQREHYLAALVQVQQTLLAASNAPLAASFPQILKLLGEAAGASRVYIFENHLTGTNTNTGTGQPQTKIPGIGNLRINQQAEWCAPGISMKLQHPEQQNMALSTFLPRWQPILAAGGEIASEVADLPLLERKFLQQQGVKSILILPLIVSDEVFGIIGFDNCIQARPWEALEIAFLRAAASALSQAQERLVSEAALKISEGRLYKSVATNRALLAAIPDALLRLGLDGQIVNMQPSPSDNSLGGARGESSDNLETVIGKNLTDVFPKDLAKEFELHIKSVLTGQHSVEFEYGIEVAGVYRDYEARCVVSGENEVMVIVRDITERKTMERLKSDFVSTVSHELRTPLTSIRGSLGLIKGGVAGQISTEAKAMIEIAYANTERLVRLVSDILDIEKIESGKLVFNMQPLALMSLVEQAVEANRAYGEQFIIQFIINKDKEVNLSKSQIMVKVDSDRLMQVFANLLSNAAKFSPPGESVIIELKPVSDSSIRVKVMDKGSGIQFEFQSRIFQKFSQADNSTTRSKGGTGLGLSIAKAIVEAHGAELNFESNGTRGTTFYFDLPLLINSTN